MLRRVKNLAKVVNPSKSGLAGATQQTKNHLTTNDTAISKILEYAWKLKKQGYAETTIEGRVKILKRLLRLGADLYNPESVKEAIAKNNCSEARKELMVEAYSSFLLFFGGKWDPPRYRRVEKLPFIPTEREIDDFIAGCSHTKRLATYLQLLKETGMRSGEASKLKWTDIDFINGIVRVTPGKRQQPKGPQNFKQADGHVKRPSKRFHHNIPQRYHNEKKLCKTKKQIDQKTAKP